MPNKNSSWKHYTALFDDVTFVLDVEQAYQSTFYTEFCNRKSTTSGDLIISNGDFRVSGTASFPNVPNIYVGTNGVFTSSSTRDGTFAAVTNMVIDGKMTIEKKDDVIPFGHRTMNLSLGSDAELTLPDDYTLTVLSLKVDGEEKPDGTYEADGSIDQLKSGTIVVQGIHETRYATWTGEGEGTSVGLAQNWSADVTGHLSDASLVATFATGGSTATVDRAMSLVGMNFLCARSFTLAGAYPISLEASGLAIDPTGVAGETYLCVEPHVAQMTQIDQVFDIPENATLDFAGGYSQSIASDNVKKGAGTLRLGGVGEMPGTLDVAGGTCVLSGTNRIDYAVTVTNGTVRFNGRLYQNAGSPGSYTAVSQLPGDRDMVVTCTLLGGSPRSKIEFDNAQIEKKFIVNAAGKDVSTDWFTALAGTTNTIKGQFCCKSTFGYATLEPDSVLRFAAPVYFSGETIFRRGGDSGTATVAFTNYTGRFTGGGNGLTVQSGVICRLESAAGSTLPSVLQITGTGRLECTADDALRIIRNDNGVLSATNSVRLNNTSVMDIGATRQGIALFNTSSIGGGVSGNSNAIVTGLPGSELKVFRGYLWQDVQGGVSVTSAGDPGRVLTATNRAYSSTGDIKAESGTFRFGANASWPNGTNVTICAGATLEVNRSRTFGDHAVLHAEGEDWTLSLASGVRQKFAQFYIDGVRQPDGVYGATGNGAVMYRMDNITGEGVIVVGTPGSVLILR